MGGVPDREWEESRREKVGGVPERDSGCRPGERKGTEAWRVEGVEAQREKVGGGPERENGQKPGKRKRAMEKGPESGKESKWAGSPRKSQGVEAQGE